MATYQVTYRTRRHETSNGQPGYIYRTDAECSCGWSHSAHYDDGQSIFRIGEQHLASHESTGE